MEGHDNAITKLSKLSFEGRMGETLNLTSKHRLLPPKNSENDEILGPEAGQLELRIGVRIDRKLVKVEELLQSGLLKAVYRFFREHGSYLRIHCIHDTEEGESKTVTVPLQLEPLPDPLARNIHDPTRLESIYAQFIFYSSNSAPKSRLAQTLKQQLISPNMSPHLQSLLFRSLQRFCITLASKYPLIFNGAFVEKLGKDHTYVYALSKSLSRLTLDLPEELAAVFRMAMKRFEGSSIVSDSTATQESERIPDDLDDLLEQSSQLQPSCTSSMQTTLESALSSLSRHATKRKKVFSGDMVTPEVSETGSPGRIEEGEEDDNETIYGHLDDSGNLLLCQLLDDDEDEEGKTSFVQQMEEPDDDLPSAHYQDSYTEAELRASKALDEYEDAALRKWQASRRFPLPQGVLLEEYGGEEILGELMRMNASQDFRYDQQLEEQVEEEGSSSTPIKKRRKRTIAQDEDLQADYLPLYQSSQSRHYADGTADDPVTLDGDEEETTVECTLQTQSREDTEMLQIEDDDKNVPNSRSKDPKDDEQQEVEEQNDSGYSVHSCDRKGKKRALSEADFEREVEAGLAKLLKRDNSTFLPYTEDNEGTREFEDGDGDMHTGYGEPFEEEARMQEVHEEFDLFDFFDAYD